MCPDRPAASKRYRFVHDDLTTRPPVRGTELGVTKDDPGVRDYLAALPDYLTRLANEHDGSSEGCPFCAFEIDPEAAAYLTDDGREPFVSTPRTHRSCWDRGWMLTYNPSGWHTINELVVPREHRPTDALVGTATDWLPITYSRWARHGDALERRTDRPGTEALHHGVVANLRAGQSVAHGHAHCYTSVHDRQTHPAAREAILSTRAAKRRVDVSLVPFDLPRVVVRTDAGRGTDWETTMAAFGEACATACLKTFADLCGVAPPASVGWFYDPTDTTYEVAYQPMRRAGSMESFYSGRFHRFDASDLVEAIEPAVSRHLDLPSRDAR
jgi:hypothetical protein